MRRAASAPVPAWKTPPVVRETDERRTRSTLALAARLTLVLLPFLAYMVLQIHYLKLRYSIDMVRVQHARLVEAERRLRTERAALAALPHVEARAQGDLGLVRPSPEEILVLSSSPRTGAGTVGALVAQPTAAR
jgi:hypothetical protein